MDTSLPRGKITLRNFNGEGERMQRYYRVPVAAKLLGLNVSALYKIIRDGGLDAHHKHPLTITKQSMFKFLESRHPGLRLICTAEQRQ